MPFLSAVCDSVLQTSTTSIGILHSAPFSLEDRPFGMMLIFLKRNLLAIRTLSSFLISLNSFGSLQTLGILHTAWQGIQFLFNFFPNVLHFKKLRSNDKTRLNTSSEIVLNLFPLIKLTDLLYRRRLQATHK